mgnify:CR=1 FL=1
MPCKQLQQCALLSGHHPPAAQAPEAGFHGPCGTILASMQPDAGPGYDPIAAGPHGGAARGPLADATPWPALARATQRGLPHANAAGARAWARARAQARARARSHPRTHTHTCTQTLTQTRAQTHWVQAHRRRDDAARARLRRTLHLPRVRVEGKGTPGIGGEGGARARPEPPPCPLLLRARRRWRGMRFGCCAPGTGERNDHSERRADRRSGFRSAEGVSLGRTAAVWSSGEPSTWSGLVMTIS